MHGHSDVRLTCALRVRHGFFPSDFRVFIMRIAMFVGLALLLLGGCTTDSEKGLCPTAAILAPTSVVTVFRDNAPRDPSGVLYTLWMTNVKSGCDFDKDRRTTDSHLTVAFTAKRAPGGQAVSYKIPYFIAVTKGGDKIMTKRIFLAQLTFAAGQAETTFEQEVDSTIIKFERGAKVGDYQILAGFQLTQGQLDYNKQTNQYVP